jgi:hypothetical protein
MNLWEALVLMVAIIAVAVVLVAMIAPGIFVRARPPASHVTYEVRDRFPRRDFLASQQPLWYSETKTTKTTTRHRPKTKED